MFWAGADTAFGLLGSAICYVGCCGLCLSGCYEFCLWAVVDFAFGLLQLFPGYWGLVLSCCRLCFRAAVDFASNCCEYSSVLYVYCWLRICLGLILYCGFCLWATAVLWILLPGCCYCCEAFFFRTAVTLQILLCSVVQCIGCAFGLMLGGGFCFRAAAAARFWFRDATVRCILMPFGMLLCSGLLFSDCCCAVDFGLACWCAVDFVVGFAFGLLLCSGLCSRNTTVWWNSFSGCCYVTNLSLSGCCWTTPWIGPRGRLSPWATADLAPRRWRV